MHRLEPVKDIYTGQSIDLESTYARSIAKNRLAGIEVLCVPATVIYTKTELAAMTLDQKIQIWVAVGTWLSSIGTVAAVIAALYLAKRVEKVRLKVHVGLMEVVLGDGSPFERHLGINVTNLGERPVTINTVGWAVGKGKNRRFAVQPLHSPHTAQYPIELAHGKSANFMVSFLIMPDWPRDFATGFVRDLSPKSLKTLVVQIHTSVGEIVEAKPRKDLLEELKKSGQPKA